MNQNKKMTIQDFYNILLTHAKDKKVKHCNIVMLDSDNFGPTIYFNDAINDVDGIKSLKVLVERINAFYSTSYGK
jgi:hypothetical protein